MYSSFSYRKESKRLNHKGRIIRTKSDYKRPPSGVINQEKLNEYTQILKSQGKWPIIPPPDVPIAHDDTFEFTLTQSGNQYTISNLNSLALLMTAYCATDNHRYCYFPFGIQATKTNNQGPSRACFKFQTGDTSDNCLYLLVENNAATSFVSNTKCIWLVYDSTLDRYYIWFTGEEGSSSVENFSYIDDVNYSDVSYKEVQKITDVMHPIYQINDIYSSLLCLFNYSNFYMTLTQQPSRENKIYTSDAFDDPSRL